LGLVSSCNLHDGTEHDAIAVIGPRVFM